MKDLNKNMMITFELVAATALTVWASFLCLVLVKAIPSNEDDLMIERAKEAREARQLKGRR